METYKAFKYRLYPTPEQETLIQKTFGCHRFVYNHFLQMEISNYELGGKYLTKFDNMKTLTTLKKEIEWLNEVPLPALRSALEDLDFAFKAFFKAKGKVGFPRFHSKHDHDKSFRIDNSDRRSVRVEGNTLHVTKIGDIPAVFHRPVGGPIVKATIRQTPSGKYFAALICKVDIEPLTSTGRAVGIDMGLKDFAITSDGEKYPNPKYLSKSLKKLRREQRRLSRKKKGSNNWNKQRIKVARIHEKITNQRRDMTQKLSAKLVRQYDIIGIEDLSTKNMIQNHHLAKSISDASWSEFRRELEYKAGWYKRVLIAVDRFFPSSQLCSACGAQWPGTKDLSVRKWTCPQCGAIHDRDVSASINILKEGLRLLGEE